MPTTNHYNLFYEFFDRYEGASFDSISNQEPFMKKLNETLDSNHQFFFVGDMIKYQITYISPQIKALHGMSPDSFHPGYLITKVYPDDLMRLTKGRTKQMETAQALYVKKGSEIMMRNMSIYLSNATSSIANLTILFTSFIWKPRLQDFRNFSMAVFIGI